MGCAFGRSLPHNSIITLYSVDAWASDVIKNKSMTWTLQQQAAAGAEAQASKQQRGAEAQASKQQRGVGGGEGIQAAAGGGRRRRQQQHTTTHTHTSGSIGIHTQAARKRQRANGHGNSNGSQSTTATITITITTIIPTPLSRCCSHQEQQCRPSSGTRSGRTWTARPRA